MKLSYLKIDIHTPITILNWGNINLVVESTFLKLLGV